VTRSRQIWTAGLLGALALGGVACRARPQGPVRLYHLEGTVLAIDRERSQLVVQHGDIPGFMAAMTMPYAVVHPEDLMKLETGDRIGANIVVQGTDVHLDHIVILSHVVPRSAPR
jgi:protein SCO1